MQLSKKEMVTAAFCAAAYAFLAVLIALGQPVEHHRFLRGDRYIHQRGHGPVFRPLCGKKKRRACCGLCPCW